MHERQLRHSGRVRLTAMSRGKTATAALYRDFADNHAAAVSPRYAEFANGVASDDKVLQLLAARPLEKRQPNLLFAAVRLVCGLPDSYAHFRQVLLAHVDEVMAVVANRRTQTNEVARCAAIYPILAGLRQPLALLEVGASAGLCLLPDRYAYSYSDGSQVGDTGSPVQVSCQVHGPWSAPGQAHVIWRGGIDLNPLSVHDPADMRWLELLIWPGQPQRVRRLHAAIEVARQQPPQVVAGDLIEQFGPLAASAPAGATLVVYHAAVLTYLPARRRRVFADVVARAGGVWIAQEAPGVLDWIVTPAPPDPSAFLLTVDGRPAAWTAAHGGWVRWLDSAESIARRASSGRLGSTG
jgi:hypothetical protein